MSEDHTKGVAYQIIAALASETGLWEHPEVQRALDFFSKGGETPLPWPRDPLMAEGQPKDGGSRYLNEGGAFQGMTARDWFAGQALAGWLASFGPDDAVKAKAVAEFAYEVADEMLKVRGGGDG